MTLTYRDLSAQSRPPKKLMAALAMQVKELYREQETIDIAEFLRIYQIAASIINGGSPEEYALRNVDVAAISKAMEQS